MRVASWSVPVLVVLAAALGIGAADLFTVPTFTREFPGGTAAAGGGLETAVFTVDGLKCMDTAVKAAAQLDEVPGVARFVAYASRNRADVTFDPSRTSAEDLRAAIEAPVYDPGTGEFYFNVFRVLKTEGETR